MDVPDTLDVPDTPRIPPDTPRIPPGSQQQKKLLPSVDFADIANESKIFPDLRYFANYFERRPYARRERQMGS